MNEYYYPIDLPKIIKRCANLPDTFLFAELPSILGVAKGTAMKISDAIQLTKVEISEGYAINKYELIDKLRLFSERVT